MKRTMASKKKAAQVQEPEMEQPRRAAVEDVDFVNSFNHSTVEKEKTLSDDDASFEDPYDFNYATYDQFKTMMTKHCSKTYTDTKQAPSPSESQFDVLLNKLNYQELLSERASSSTHLQHERAPFDISSSDISDDNEAQLVSNQKMEQTTTKKVKAVPTKLKKVKRFTPKIFESDEKSSSDTDVNVDTALANVQNKIPLPKGRNRKRAAPIPTKVTIEKSSRKTKQNTNKTAKAKTDENSLNTRRGRTRPNSNGSTEEPQPVPSPAEVAEPVNAKSKTFVIKSDSKLKRRSAKERLPSPAASSTPVKTNPRRTLRPRQEKASTSAASRLRK